MKNVIIMLAIFLLGMQFGNCQVTKKKMGESKNPVEKDIYNLSTNKYLYENHVRMARVKPAEYAAKRDDFKTKYTALLKKIRENPSVYLPFLNQVIAENDSVSYRRIPYMDYDSSGPGDDINYYFVTRLELCKIVKFCLIEKKMEELPQDFKTLPFISKRGFKGATVIYSK